jgi:hypothetical protein
MGDPLRRLRKPLSAALVLGVLMALPTQAHADEDDEEAEKPKRRGLIVTVEDNDDVADGPAPKKRAPFAPPVEGAPESEINAYLRELKKDVRDTQIAAKEAARAGDADEAMRLKEELRDKKALLKDETARLTTRDVGLIAGGATLTGLGCISLVSSFVLIVVYGVSAADGDADHEYGWASLGTLGGGVLGLSAGIPMIVVGSRRQVRGSEEEYARDLAPTGQKPRVGFTMSLSF